MPLPAPSLASAKAVFNLATPTQRRPDQDDAFIAAVRDEFPSVVAHQFLPAETPLNVPHLVVQSTASRAAVSALGVEVDTRFYGEYQTELDGSFAYIRRKLHAIAAGWEAIGVAPAFAGVIVVSHVDFAEQETAPAQFIAERHLRRAPEPDSLQDAVVRLAVRYADENFVNLTLSNYEIKGLMRPVFGGQQLVQVPRMGRRGSGAGHRAHGRCQQSARCSCA